ncbi:MULTISPECIES: hypothetical protein [Burkholderia]|nr:MULTISPECIES: hypothetical protein [Burkholderia]MDP9549684.1 hypothetical protein [Burkholderia cepacia]MBR8393367.1 hypothetical protein [Burkholderia cenocepacia]MBR8473286.1 hypothetical protein [Burkholderia cenocepacia]MBR8491757.1 hypothetical protein [Burkholderia cenocepacia]MDO5919705.1 hypothetical protein [Burkholderia cenocepacia]
MSNDLFNIRIGIYHFRLERGFRARVSRNDYHRGYPDGFFRVYTAFGRTR